MKTTYGRILVTGATGFIGGALVDELLARRYSVRALGRNLERGMRLQARGAEFLPVDLRDRASMIRACRDVDAVFHVGALAAPWGPVKDFEDINVGGTQNVIDGCRENGVRRLVYVSSPSVSSKFVDQFDLVESQRPGPDFVSTYSRTKWEGEVLVAAANSDSLQTVIIRPKAVYGPGDTTIFPRIIEAARRRSGLPQIGDGSTLTNMTFIDDVVEGLCLAMESAEAPGNTYVLTGGEDVALWEIIGDVLDRVGSGVGERKLSIRRAMSLAKTIETLWRLFGLSGEPPLTRYTVGIFAYSQTYDISAARRDLGYEPKVSVAEGVARFVESYGDAGNDSDDKNDKKVEVDADEGSEEPPEVEWELMTAGTLSVPKFAVFPEGGSGKITLPALFALIEHPTEGTILFDTGYSERFFEATRTFPARIFRWLTPAEIDESSEAANQLRERGVDPKSVKTILLSHFDPDHYGGLRDFPNARIVCTAQAWASVRGKSGIKALKARILPGHLPEDLAARLTILPDFDGPPIGPFTNSLDIFSDGTMRAVMLPGHAPGQYGLFLRRCSDDMVFLAADGCWTGRSLAYEKPRGRVHRIIADDKGAQDETYLQLRRLTQQMPDVTIIPSHCPDAALRFGVFADE